MWLQSCVKYNKINDEKNFAILATSSYPFSICLMISKALSKEKKEESRGFGRFVLPGSPRNVGFSYLCKQNLGQSFEDTPNPFSSRNNNPEATTHYFLR